MNECGDMSEEGCMVKETHDVHICMYVGMYYIFETRIKYSAKHLYQNLKYFLIYKNQKKCPNSKPNN